MVTEHEPSESLTEGEKPISQGLPLTSSQCHPGFLPNHVYLDRMTVIFQSGFILHTFCLVDSLAKPPRLHLLQVNEYIRELLTKRSPPRIGINVRG